MKRILFVFIVIFVIVLARAPTARALQSGTLVRGSSPAVYYFALDGRRYAFPNERIYWSWYADFSTVRRISDTQLASIPLGGVIHYRPGLRLVKVNTDPKVYVTDRGGVLRWVTTESVARAMYGSTWNLTVDDLPDAFFVQYRIGAPIWAESDFVPAEARSSSATIDDDLAHRNSSVIQLQVSPATSTPAMPVAFDWKARIDRLPFASYQRSVDATGKLVLTNGRFKVILPDTNAEDYGKMRLHQLRMCVEREEPILGMPTKTEILSDVTNIVPQGGVSACCGEAPDYPIVNLVTAETLRDLAYSTDVYWKQSTTDLNACLGGHEEVHRNVLGGIIPGWANEGLAQYMEEAFRRLPGTPAAPALSSCGTSSFRGIGFSSGTEEEIPYRNVITDGQREPRIYWYLTGACFWDHVAKTYGDSTIRSILDRAKFLSEPTPADSGTYNDTFIRDAVVPVVGEGIWRFLNNIGIPS